MEFTRKLKLHMKRERYSQQDIADALHVSQGLVSGWCNGKYKPDVHQGKALADELKLSLDYLLDDTIAVYGAEALRADRGARDIAREIGPERTWKRMVVNERLDAEPRFVPPPQPRIIRDDEVG